MLELTIILCSGGLASAAGRPGSQPNYTIIKGISWHSKRAIVPDLIQYSPSITEIRATAGRAGRLCWRWRRPAQPILAPPRTPPRSQQRAQPSHILVSLCDCIFSCSSSSWNRDVSEFVCFFVSTLKLVVRMMLRKAQTLLFPFKKSRIPLFPIPLCLWNLRWSP